MVILPFTPVDMEETNELNETERGEGGFGHTGK
jgi:dUTPase